LTAMTAGDLPAPTFAITLHDPTVVVIDASLPNAEGGMTPVKVLRYMDKANPHMQVDVALTLDVAQIIADRLSRRPSGLVLPPTPSVGGAPGAGSTGGGSA
jgi:hypothetical protein